jgi:hypothetical protein
MLSYYKLQDEYRYEKIIVCDITILLKIESSKFLTCFPVSLIYTVRLKVQHEKVTAWAKANPIYTGKKNSDGNCFTGLNSDEKLMAGEVNMMEI